MEKKMRRKTNRQTNKQTKTKPWYHVDNHARYKAKSCKLKRPFYPIHIIINPCALPNNLSNSCVKCVKNKINMSMTCLLALLTIFYFSYTLLCQITAWNFVLEENTRNYIIMVMNIL